MKIYFKESGKYRVGMTLPVAVVTNEDVKSKTAYEAEAEHANELIKAEKAAEATGKPATAAKAPEKTDK